MKKITETRPKRKDVQIEPVIEADYSMVRPGWRDQA